MIKLLYIPNACYLNFYVGENYELSPDISLLFEKTMHKTKRDLILFILEHSGDAAWKRFHNIECNHKFQEYELEFIDD